MEDKNLKELKEMINYFNERYNGTFTNENIPLINNPQIIMCNLLLGILTEIKQIKEEINNANIPKL